MSYTLVTETAFANDAFNCPKCDGAAWALDETDDAVVFMSCENRHGWYYLETVSGPESGAGELGYWLPA